MATIEPKTRPVGPHIVCSPTVTPIDNTTPNLSGQGGLINPLECDFYSYSIQYQENPQDGSIVKEGWKISGDVPLDLTIDSGGTISGTVKIMNDQPSIQALLNTKADKVKLNGENWQELGRPTCEFFIFTFEAWMEYTFITKEKVPIPYMSAPIPVIVKEIKNHTINDYIALRNYLTPGTSPVSTANGDVDVQHRFDIAGKKYTIDNFDQYIADSGSSIPPCGTDL